MSGGKKKKYPKKRTYSESEMRRGIKDAADDAVKRVMLLCIVAARDQFNLDDEGVVNFTGRMQRYVEWEKEGLVNLDDANASLKKHGIDLQLRRW